MGSSALAEGRPGEKPPDQGNDMSRKLQDVKSTVDGLTILTLRGTLSGSAGGNDMSGSLIKGTELGAYVTYPSSSNPGYSTVLPTGSVLVTMPAGPPGNQFFQIYYWDVQLLPYSGSSGSMGALYEGATIGNSGLARATSNPFSYEPIQYFASEASSSFAFGVAQPFVVSGNLPNIVLSGTVPQDTLHPNQPALEWQLLAFGRYTNRQT